LSRRRDTRVALVLIVFDLRASPEVKSEVSRAVSHVAMNVNVRERHIGRQGRLVLGQEALNEVTIEDVSCAEF
jgi:hypothetical protein